MLDQLSKCFATAHVSVDVLLHNGYLPFKIDKYQVGWLSPQAWVVLAQFKHIFQLHNNAVSIVLSTNDVATRNHFLHKVLLKLSEKEWLIPLHNERFDIISPLNQNLCSIDVAGALFFGLELPVISLTAFFEHKGEYFYWINQDNLRSFNLLFQDVLLSNTNISDMLNRACASLQINTGSAMTIGCIATKRLIKEGLLRCRMQNYLIEVPSSLNISQAKRDARAVSHVELIQILSEPNKFSIESSIILSDILQRHGKLEILPNGVKSIYTPKNTHNKS
jgi:Domain of unknown function (DUF4743)